MVESGYGHSTPATKPGKMFTVAYCTLGIPLAMIMFQVMVVLKMNFPVAVIIFAVDRVYTTNPKNSNIRAIERSLRTPRIVIIRKRFTV